MKPVIQTKVGSGENGETAGNCMRACLASIMEVDIDSIPPIEDLPEKEWFDVFRQWLNDLGYDYYGWGKPEDIKNSKFNRGIDGYLMVAGGSPRGYRRGHAVVFKDGEMVHDPHPSGEGITDLEGFYMIERISEQEEDND